MIVAVSHCVVRHASGVLGVIDVQNRMKPRLCRWMWVGAVAAVPLLFFGWLFFDDVSRSVRRAEECLRRGELDEALAAGKQALARRPKDPRALLLAGNISAAMGNARSAVDYFDQIPDSAGSFALEARLAAGDLLTTRLKQLAGAEVQFRRAERIDSRSPHVAEWLAYVLGIRGQWWEMISYRLATIERGAMDSTHLYLLAQGEDGLESEEVLRDYQSANQDDAALQVGLARHAGRRQDLAQAEEMLRRAIAAPQSPLAARLVLCDMLLAQRRTQEFDELSRQFPDSVRTHPTYWKLRGMREMVADRQDGALRCFWEACRLDPTQMLANVQLARLLRARGEAEPAALFERRAVDLQKQYTAAKVAHTSQRDTDLRAAVAASESIGQLWEAYGWQRLVVQQRANSADDLSELRQHRARLAGAPLIRTAPEFNLATRLDYSHLPLLDIPVLDRSSLAVADSTNADFSVAHTAAMVTSFRDDASRAGINFQFFNGHDPGRQSHRMYEFTGGGSAALDFDLDGYADLYFSQGCRWPPQSDQREHLDRLYRNRGDGRFEDVTESAGLIEERFSQGIASGDINNDGFPDLFLANIGENRLWINNGDGTFTDIQRSPAPDDSRRGALAKRQWSTSAAVADLNGDQHPDIYIVNYLDGPDIFERLCGSPARRHSCTPHDFPAAQDQLLLSDGQGGFLDATQDAGIVVPDGKGLGIIVADCFRLGQLDIFVANDAVPNFFFVNEQLASGLRFSEQAVPRGLAFNGAGRAEACMGIACGDVNSDGRLDLLVTNFHDESNTLYQQTTGESFLDATQQSGLREPSIAMLGFGAQFVDGDSDGDFDLAIANGHVDDFRADGIPWKMPPQYFGNRGAGKFELLAAANVGEYFARQLLGRGVTRLDWNRDGLDDLVVSHLDAPAALLTNIARDPGGYLVMRFTAVDSARDAIGLTAEAEVNGRTLVRQLVAGSGYMASNELQLHFGLGTAEGVEKLTVRWPSGRKQVLRDIPRNSRWLMVEGRADLIAQP